MDNITKALYSNHINIIRNESEEIEEYDVVNEQDVSELIEFLKHYKPVSYTHLTLPTKA